MEVIVHLEQLNHVPAKVISPAPEHAVERRNGVLVIVQFRQESVFLVQSESVKKRTSSSSALLYNRPYRGPHSSPGQPYSLPW